MYYKDNIVVRNIEKLHNLINKLFELINDMKRTLLFIFIVFIYLHSIKGQSVTLSFKPGIIILNSKYKEKPAFLGLNLSPRLSYSLALTGQLTISTMIDMMCEIKFIEKGYNIDWATNDYDVYKNGYISSPILIIFKPVPKINFQIGPEFSYLIYSKLKNNKGPIYPYKSDYQHAFELALLLGSSFDISKNLNIGARYGLSLTPYEKGEISGTNSEFKIFNRYFEVFLNTKIPNFFSKKQH